MKARRAAAACRSCVQHNTTLWQNSNRHATKQAACNTRHATLNAPHTHTTYSMRTCNMRRCNGQQDATDNTQHSTCGMQDATGTVPAYNLASATCSTTHAAISSFIATYNTIRSVREHHWPLRTSGRTAVYCGLAARPLLRRSVRCHSVVRRTVARAAIPLAVALSCQLLHRRPLERREWVDAFFVLFFPPLLRCVHLRTVILEQRKKKEQTPRHSCKQTHTSSGPNRTCIDDWPYARRYLIFSYSLTLSALSVPTSAACARLQ